jgi:cytochrome b involved in lipid metabolism
MEEFTAKDIALHNAPKDAWIIVHGVGKQHVYVK